MSAWEVFLAVVGACGTICAIVFGYLAYKRNGKSDNKDEGKKDGVVLTELGYIKSGVDDIKRKQEKQDDQIGKVLERLSSVESSAKQAHHRIDTIEQQLYKK
jgi:hypothetical protein